MWEFVRCWYSALYRVLLLAERAGTAVTMHKSLTVYV
jgi:hypothetical protein